MSITRENLFDKRTIERNLKKSRLNEKDLEQYMRELPDVGDKAMPMFGEEEVEEEQGEAEEDEE